MSPRYSIVTSSIRGHDYTICITQSQIHPTNTKYFKECPKVSTGESRKRVPTPMHRFMGRTRKLVTKTYIKCSQIKTQSDKITSRGKLNSSQESRGGETSEDLTIIAKLAIHQDRAIERTREREI